MAKEVGRTAADCRDRCRNHLEHRDDRDSGNFHTFEFGNGHNFLLTIPGKLSQAEEAELIELWSGKQINSKSVTRWVTNELGSSTNRSCGLVGRMDCAYSRSQVSILSVRSVIFRVEPSFQLARIHPLGC